LATSHAADAGIIFGAGSLVVASATFALNARRNSRADKKAARAEAERQEREIKEQATKVFSYLEPDPQLFHLMITKNQSSAPVWEVGRCFVDKRYPSAYDWIEDLPSLPPGARVTLQAPTVYLDKNIAVWLSFRDVAGRWWVREQTGVLVGPLSTKPSRPPWYATDKLRTETLASLAPAIARARTARHVPRLPSTATRARQVAARCCCRRCRHWSSCCFGGQRRKFGRGAPRGS
jgi:hypothetical protein